MSLMMNAVGGGQAGGGGAPYAQQPQGPPSQNGPFGGQAPSHVDWSATPANRGGRGAIGGSVARGGPNTMGGIARGGSGAAPRGRGSFRGGAAGTVLPPPQATSRFVDPALLAVNTSESEATRGAGGGAGRGAATSDGAGGGGGHVPFAPNKVYAVVEFKNQRLKRYECSGPNVASDISPGQYVIVDGDRGEDCGLVVLVGRTSDDGALQVEQVEGTNVQLGKLKNETGRVLRIAAGAEIDTLHNGIAVLEQQALKACRERCRELGMDLNVMDCEYQFDGKKISFYYDSDHSVDYRDLVKDLYKMFGARIWMENVNSKVKNVVPAGALSRHQKAAMQRRHEGGGPMGGGGHHHHQGGGYHGGGGQPSHYTGGHATTMFNSSRFPDFHQ